ncbi:hypothetical protein BH20VER2_BH20VER2_03740 [soil metagenome]
MLPAVNRSTDVHRLLPNAFVWQLYDPALKAELFSSGIVTSRGVYLVDPVPVDEDALSGAIGEAEVAGVIITNANHARTAIATAELFDVPIHSHAEARSTLDADEVVEIGHGEGSPPGLTSIHIKGAPRGEVALHCSRDGGTLIIGDAVIDLGSDGFALLPAKYCTDPKQMRRSLRQLLEFDFERLLFAHGTPITADAKARFAELLDRGS